MYIISVYISGAQHIVHLTICIWLPFPSWLHSSAVEAVGSLVSERQDPSTAQALRTLTASSKLNLLVAGGGL